MNMEYQTVTGGWYCGRGCRTGKWADALGDYLMRLASRMLQHRMDDVSALVMDDKETTTIGKPYKSPLYGKVVIVPYCWLVEQPEYKAIRADWVAEQAVKVLTQ